MTLTWNNGKLKGTVPLGNNDNFGTFTMAMGYFKFLAYCTKIGIPDSELDSNPIIINRLNVPRPQHL